MATAIQWRRGTTSQHSSFTGLVGEITVDTDLDTLRVHDGSTAGGHRLAKYSEIGDITAVTAGDGLSGGGTSGALSIALDLNELTAATVAVDADSGAIGGAASQEFMVTAESGEDLILISSDGEYGANQEKAVSIMEEGKPLDIKTPSIINTPNQKTIEDLCNYNNFHPSQVLSLIHI